MTQALASQGAEALLLATFWVRDTLCALDAAGVHEVIRLSTLTPVPHAPEEVLGIINLRGRIVTILDVGLKLGFPRAEPGPESRIFIVEDAGEHIGLLVDRVGEVMEAEKSRLEPPPANISSAQGRSFREVYRAPGRVAAVLALDTILAGGA